MKIRRNLKYKIALGLSIIIICGIVVLIADMFNYRLVESAVALIGLFTYDRA